MEEAQARASNLLSFLQQKTSFMWAGWQRGEGPDVLLYIPSGRGLPANLACQRLCCCFSSPAHHGHHGRAVGNRGREGAWGCPMLAQPELPFCSLPAAGRDIFLSIWHLLLTPQLGRGGLCCGVLLQGSSLIFLKKAQHKTQPKGFCSFKENGLSMR